MSVREIRVLAEHVINQIAAGEVIERPASVVKELVENSIDAGARRIAVEIAGGGKALVRVVDDGCGMSRAEMRLALTRHATSKLRDASDLELLETMGFRGEALPSIAAVSRMVITSRRRGDTHPAAWALTIEGGSVRSEDEVGAPVGTTIEVRDLLFNLPARQKFMRTETTETGHIVDCVTKLALAHPEVHLRLLHKKRTTLDAPVSRDRGERAAALLGNKFAAQHIEASGEGGGISVRALLGAPELAQRSARGVQLFVGRRPVRDRGLLAAVVAGYGETLGSGRYPSAIVFVEPAPGDVDINVHPQKHEVRFADPQAIYAVVKGVIERAVSDSSWSRAVAVGEEPAAAIAADVSRPSRAAERLASYAASRRAGAQLLTRMPPPRHTSSPPQPARVRPSVVTTASDANAGKRARLRFLGELDDTYLVCEGDGELVLVDIGRARRRIALSRLKDDIAAGTLRAQRLLFPEPIELGTYRSDDSGDDASSDGARSIAELGCELDDTGSLTAIPAGLRPEDGAAVVKQLLAAETRDERLGILAGALAAAIDPRQVLAHLDEAGPGEVVRCPVEELAARLLRE